MELYRHIVAKSYEKMLEIMLQLTDYRCPANQSMCSQAVGNFCKERAFIRYMNTMDAVLFYKDVSFKWSSKFCSQYELHVLIAMELVLRNYFQVKRSALHVMSNKHGSKAYI